MNNKSLLIAVDFDGTICDDGYPGIGKPKMFAFETLKKLQQDGHRLILWTFRSGKTLEEAVEFCSKKGIEFYAVNGSFQGESFDEAKASRKINADLFIDDRNLGGFPGWSEVYHVIKNGTQFEVNMYGEEQPKKKKGFFRL